MEGEKREYESFEKLYKDHYNMVYRYIRRMVRNDENVADDLTQDVFLIAYQKWDILKEHPNVPGFLMLSAKNVLKKWFDAQNGISVSGEEILEALTGDRQKEVEMDDFGRVDLYDTIKNVLPVRDIAILKHYYEYGYTSAEMAQKLGISESCFKMRVLRMKKKLRSSIKTLSFFFLMIGM